LPTSISSKDFVLRQRNESRNGMCPRRRFPQLDTILNPHDALHQLLIFNS